MLLSSLPIFLHGQQIELSNNLSGYVNSQGILQSNKLPQHLLNDIRGLIRNNEVESLFGKINLSTGICDTGSSLICSPFAKDFKKDSLKPIEKKRSMNGIAGELQITHAGITNYQTIDTEGRIVSIQKQGFLVPGLPARLIPPQKLMRNDQNEWYKINNKHEVLKFIGGQKVKTSMNP